MPKDNFRILFITRKFPPSTGGMENYAHDLYTSLQGKASIKLIKWGGSNKLLPLVLPWFFVRAVLELIKGRIDIIHAQDGIVSVLGVILSIIFRKPLAVVIHGLDITHKNWLYQMIIPRAVRRADVVFCISQAAADEAIERGVPKEIIRVIPLGIVDENGPHNKEQARQQLNIALGLEENNKLILTVGRLVRRKGVAWFIANCLPAIVATNPNTIYLVPGDGEDSENIKSAIQSAKMERSVKLLGRVDDELLKNLYNGSDIFVMPNIVVPGDMEGFGRVLLEASLCKLPVVASGIEGIKDAISHEKNGILVETENAKAFEKAINKFLKDSELANSFGKKSREYTLTNFQWAKIASYYIDGYKSIVE